MSNNLLIIEKFLGWLEIFVNSLYFINIIIKFVFIQIKKLIVLKSTYNARNTVYILRIFFSLKYLISFNNVIGLD